MVERQYMLVGVEGSPDELTEAFRWCGVFRGAVVSRTQTNLVIELAGSPGRLDAALRLIGPHVKHRVVRSGLLVMPRTSATTAVHCAAYLPAHAAEKR